MEAVAKEAGAIINAVMLGAIAGCGRLPIPVEAFEAAIRADGKAAEANLRGFRAGLDRGADRGDRTAPRQPRTSGAKSRATISPRSKREIRDRMPKPARIS